MVKTYYHISPIDNKKSIISNGLKCNEDGETFLFDTLSQAKYISINQVFLDEYSLFKIDYKGIEVEPKRDMVMEMGADSQYIIKQTSIKPQFIKHLKDESLNFMNESFKQEFLQKKKIGEYRGLIPKEAEEYAIDNLRLFENSLRYVNKRFKKKYTLLSIDELNSKWNSK